MQPALKTERVHCCAHNMGSHMSTCVCMCQVQTHVNISDPILCAHQGTHSVFKAGLKMAA
jgi:hypothetical protein